MQRRNIVAGRPHPSLQLGHLVAVELIAGIVGTNVDDARHRCCCASPACWRCCSRCTDSSWLPEVLLPQGDLAHSWAWRGRMLAFVLQHSSLGSVGEKCITMQPCQANSVWAGWLRPWGWQASRRLATWVLGMLKLLRLAAATRECAAVPGGLGDASCHRWRSLR